MKREFDDTGHPCIAGALDSGTEGDAWYYVQKEGILISASGCSNCGRQRKSITMRWPAVKRALADHEKARARRKASR
jgi:hypothetical protein